MARLEPISEDKATGRIKEHYVTIKKSMGKIPNMFQSIANSPVALEAYLKTNETLSKGVLSPVERETIALVVSDYDNCEYCISAHTLWGKKAGLKDEEIMKIRKNSSDDLKLGQLAKFAKAVVSKKGVVSNEELSAVKKAGYTDAQIAEAIVVIAMTIFTNFFNHVNDTKLDFPEAPKLT